MSEIFDVAVIGAGIAGAGVGAQLAARGQKVIVLEMEDRPDRHSTGRSAAIFVQNYGNKTIRALNRASYPYLNNPPAAVFPNPVLRKQGIIFVADEESKADLDALLNAAEGLQPLSFDEAAELVPLLSPQNFVGAAYEPEAKDIDVAALHQGWLKQIKHFGGKIVFEAEMLKGQQNGDCWQLETKAGNFTAHKIANASGAWADVIAERCGVQTVGIQPKRRSIGVVTSPDPAQSMHWPMVIDAGHNWYMKPDAGQFLVSPADEDVVEPHDVFVDDMVLAEGIFRFEQMVNFQVTRVENSWAGLRVFVADNSPVCGFSQDQTGFFWLAGQGGYGIQTSAALSELAACQLMGADLPEFAENWLVESLSPARFI